MEENKSESKKPEGLWPGERIFASDIKYWCIAFTLWFLGLILLSALLWKISVLVIVSYLFALLTWLALCVQVVKEKERAKPVLFGVIGKVISYGAVLVLFPFEKLIRFPTSVRQISLASAGIQTKAGETEVFGEDGKTIKKPVPSIVLPVEPVVNFRWPSDDNPPIGNPEGESALTAAIKNAPSPEDEEALKDIFEEPILDVIRTVGGQKTFLWVLQNRTEFAAEVNKALELSAEEKEVFDNPKKDKVKGEDKSSVDPEKALAQLIYLARLRNVTVSFKHMKLPEVLQKQQEEEAAAIHKGEAAKIIKIKEGEASKQVKILEGEGTARAEAVVRTAILDVLVDEKYKNVAVMLEQMRALVAASKDSKATFVIPADILTALGSALGGSPEKTLGMSEKQLKIFAAPIIAQVLREQLKKQEKGG